MKLSAHTHTTVIVEPEILVTQETTIMSDDEIDDALDAESDPLIATDGVVVPWTDVHDLLTSMRFSLFGGAGRRSPRPDSFRSPLDKDERPRLYTRDFHEHERALAWTRMITAEHYALYGMRQGCHHVSAGRAGPGSP